MKLLLNNYRIYICFMWDAWRRGVGFDIASTAHLNEGEKRLLIRSMNAIADSCGTLTWTDEDLELLKRIKDYNYHIKYLFRNKT